MRGVRRSKLRSVVPKRDLLGSGAVRAACLITAALSLIPHAAAQPLPQPRVMLFFGLNVEADHMLFATDALRFFAEVADKDDFRAEATTNWSDLNEENLKQ